MMKTRIQALFLITASCLCLAEVPKYSEHQDLTYYLDDAGKRVEIVDTKGWQERVQQIHANMELVMGELPDLTKKTELKPEVLEEKKIGSLIRKKIRYQSDEEDQVTAWLLIPELKAGEKAPAVLCLHQTIAIGKDEPAGLGKNPHLDYALELAERGYITLSPDYASFGEHPYEFKFSYREKDAKETSRYQSGTMKAIWDNIRSVDLIYSLPEFDGENLGCIGHSLGGHNTMFTASFEPRIRAMVSCCGFTRFHKYYGGALKGWTSDRYMPRINDLYNNDPDEVPFDFPEIIGTFAPRPFLAVAPVSDSNFEVSGVKDCMNSAKKVYALFDQADHLQATYPEAGHDFPDESREHAYKFFDRHLKK